MKAPLSLNGRFFWISEDLLQNRSINHVVERPVFNKLVEGVPLVVHGVIGYSTQAEAIAALQAAIAKNTVETGHNELENISRG